MNIKSPLLTAEWETKLKEVEHGQLSPDSFMTGISGMICDLVQNNDRPDKRFLPLFPKRYDGSEIIGVCPRCGSTVSDKGKGFFCDNRDCSFVLWKDNKFFRTKKKTLTPGIAAALLKEGRVYVSGLYSEKKNKTYNAYIALDDTGGKYVNFKIEFPQQKEYKKGSRK